LPTQEELHTAVAKAINFFARSREPHALLWLDVMHRRFGIEEFADALQRFDRVLTEQPKQSPVLRVLRRMADHDNPLRIEDMEAVSHPSDRIIVCALYCDRLGLPPSFPDVLAKAVRAGGYYLPHVLLAWVWIRENGCELALPDGFIDDVCRVNAAMVNNDPMTVSDLKLEAAAILYLAGQGALVDNVFVGSVIVTQNDDGGWRRSPDGNGGSDWHATILGLLLLLHLKFSAGSI
jgi:hypothetical protein